MAEGKTFVQTKQCKIKYFFKVNPDLKPIEDNKGNLDYKNVKLIQNVRKGDKLCEFIPPEKGVQGQTVTGKIVQPEDVKEIKMPKGINVERDQNNENILLSVMDGTVKKSDDCIEVTPILIVNSNVDYSTGNIESHISTKIVGDVKSTFKVSVEKDVEINGIIEDAEIYAGGGILARAGIIGKGKGRIVAGGDISARNCQQITLISKKDIILNERVLDSVVIADGKIKIKSRNSAVYRCKLYAKDGVEIRNIGNDNYEIVEVIVGMPGELFMERESLTIKIKQLKDAIDKTEKSIKLAHKMQAFKGSSTKEKKETLLQFQKSYSDLVKQLDELKERKIKVDAEIEEKKNKEASIIVFNKIYPKVSINICDKKIITTEEASLVEFKYSDGEIIIDNLKEKYDKYEIQRMMSK